ncbi:MAG: hypothetical protein M1839_000648 [Geoglossum umbratile]|nr:MAG: hypothetical protein M1839_000648 [Geoglossum umbratile]
MPPPQQRPSSAPRLPGGQPSSSTATPKAPNTAPVKRQAPSAVSTAQVSDTHFTVFVRLPFPRDGFIDPATVDWDASKDRALWKILSRASRSSDLDWKGLADNFQVSLPFLLQQAAWLYERELSQVRAQMRRVGTLSSSNAPSPASGSTPGAAAGGYAMRRTASGGAGSTIPRVPSTLSVRSKESPIPNSVPSTPIKPSAYPMSRTSSANTAIQSRPAAPQSPRQKTDRLRRKSSLNVEALRGSPEPLQSAPQQEPQPLESPSTDTTEPSEASSSDSDSDAPQLALKSQILRTPRFMGKGKARADPFADDEDEDDEDSPAFLPFSQPSGESLPSTGSHSQDPGATLRVGLQDPGGFSAPYHQPAENTPAESHGLYEKLPQTGASSATSSSSSQAVSAAGGDGAPANNIRPGMLSPRRTAELAGKSPRRRATGKEGSDGTPSMGSSFSDLDDASVTQSALEEALLSNMQAGGMASRMSTISQALRSRYL